MAYAKRKRSSSVGSRKSFPKRARSAARRGRTGYAGILSASVRRANKGVQRLTRMIETKEACFKTTRPANAPQKFAHNTPQVIAWDSAVGNNIFTRTNGMDDPQGTSIIKMLGDSFKLQGIACKFFLENPYSRPKTYYRMMFLRGPRGAAFTDLFKGCCDNKMIDQFNTEKYKIIASKRVTVQASNVAAQAAQIGGNEPMTTVTATSAEYGGIGSKIVSFWIPGTKITKSGVINYENNANDVKFYDYKWVCLCYDWNGTPITSFCGAINEGYCKLYFKDA